MKFNFKKYNSPAEKKKRAEKNKKLANTPKQVAQRKKAYALRKGKKPPPPKTYFV
jgi:hypothetical protein